MSRSDEGLARSARCEASRSHEIEPAAISRSAKRRSRWTCAYETSFMKSVTHLLRVRARVRVRVRARARVRVRVGLMKSVTHLPWP